MKNGTWRSGHTIVAAAEPSVRVLPTINSTDSDGAVTLTVWINDITQAWARGAANTLALARLVSAARQSLRYGEWSQLWRTGKIPFSKRKGEMLVVIGMVLGNLPAQNSAQLPSAWNTLYCLARLGRPLVEQLIEEGSIHSGLTLQEAKSLLAEYQRETARKTSRSTVKQRVARFTAFVRATRVKWSQEERQFAFAKLLRLVEEIVPGGSISQEPGLVCAAPSNGTASLKSLSNKVCPQSVPSTLNRSTLFSRRCLDDHGRTGKDALRPT